MTLPLISFVERPRLAWRIFARWVAERMPKGLFARSLLIVIVPIVGLQAAVTYFYMERYWQIVTYRLSDAVTRDIAALIELHKAYPKPEDEKVFERIAVDQLKFVDVEMLGQEPLPPVLPKPFFSLLDHVLSNQIRRQIRLPFWIDTVGQSSLVEVRIKLDDGVLRVFTRRSDAYASNSHVFILYMVGTSLVLILVALAFLRNQIRPISRLAEAAENFGKGRDVDYRPSGAREVRQAGYAFLAMRRRIERNIEQRTMMLNGVSHDLRTILTRFRLSLALMESGPDVDALENDIDEMSGMLEAYLAFARGDTGEAAVATDMRKFLDNLRDDAARLGHRVTASMRGNPLVILRPDAFRRLLLNLISNAQRYGDAIAIDAARDDRFFTVNIDDDGPGIPAHQREDVFRPFYRLDEARNQDEGGSGLGLAIARDIARSHGGDITLGESPLGGLRAVVRIPV
ncbi:ATP-binding protein [Methylovirgula sp. 4M-Z18]|uniref:ATP-binding protein n=1 Tax=Methylovirgula sp. 4M-Z18 TaxID=2293567 RepID=UPI000E2EA689|nr:ATP-binding protein [Methylovirgula sp. 4M-Z18]RFB79675.1 HAMP domain-containing protein [Methylovirgula sp. 4M-Z18]